MNIMKTILIILMVAQIVLFTIGIQFLIEGKIFSGLFNTIINFIFFMVNINTLRKLNS